MEVDPDAIRRAGQLLTVVGDLLAVDLGEDIPACDNTEVSKAIANNLNARRRWLASQLRNGHTQAQEAGDGLRDTAAAYQAEDADAAARMRGGATSSARPASSPTSAAPSPASDPTMSEIPDISGRDGEILAQALEMGAGPGAVAQAIAPLTEVVAATQVIFEQLTAAHQQVLMSGESAITTPVLTKLTHTSAWVQSMGGHAAKLLTDHGTYVSANTAVRTAVGTSADYKMLKAALNKAMIENQLSGGLAQDQVNAWAEALNAKQQGATDGMSAYQSTGELVSTMTPGPGDPNLAPGAGQQGDPKANGQDPLGLLDDADGKKKSKGDKDTQPSGQDLISTLTGMPGQVMKSVGQNNPLKSASEAANQLGQQLGKGSPNSSPLKPAAMKPSPALSKGAGASKGAGGLKAGSGIGGGALHPASAIGAPGPTATATPKTVDASGGPARPTAGTGSGMGMMPPGRPGDSKGKVVESRYPDEKPAVPETGRPGVVGGTPPPAAPKDTSVQDEIQKRIAERKKSYEHD